MAKRQFDPNKQNISQKQNAAPVVPAATASVPESASRPRMAMTSTGIWEPVKTTTPSTAGGTSSAATVENSPTASRTTQDTVNQPTPAVDSGVSQKTGISSGTAAEAGVDKDIIQGIQSEYQPKIEATETATIDNAQRNEQINASLTEEQKMVEEKYNQIKEQARDISRQQQELNDESANIQAEAIRQAQAKEAFTLAQERQKFNDSAIVNEREAQRKIQDEEAQLARTLASSIGGGKGLQSMMQYSNFQLDGVNILTDLKATTAYGNAEFGFKANELERYYTTEVNKIEVERRNANVTLLAGLSETLASIDESILTSAKDKAQKARDEISRYFDKKDEIDSEYADYVSEANNRLTTEVEKVKEEKKAKETLDVDMSQTLGFFANKYGEPINTRADGTPKPFISDYDASLSEQFGHLVDARGNAIIGDDGQKIPFKLKANESLKTARANYLNGTANGYELSELNGRVGENSYLKTAFKDGDYGGQCGTFVRTNFTTDSAGWESNPNISSIQNKINLIATRGWRQGTGEPKVGDVAVFTQNYGSAGHYAMINSISEDGKSMTFTESNLDMKGTVSTTRTIPIDSSSVYGFFSPDLKPEAAAKQPVLASNNPTSEGGTENTKAAMPRIKINPAGYTLKDAAKSNGQEKQAAGFLMGAWEAEELMRKYNENGVSTTELNTMESQLKPDPILGYVPMNNIVDQMNSPQQRDVMRARLQWIENVLRPASGAAIGVAEYQMYERMYFPSPGADEAEINNSRQARETKLAGLAISSGKAAPLVEEFIQTRDPSRFMVSGGIDAPVTAAVKDSVSSASQAAGNAMGGLTNWFNQATSQPEPSAPTAVPVNKQQVFAETFDAIKEIAPDLSDDEIRALVEESM
jgi:hypothetical protein